MILLSHICSFSVYRSPWTSRLDAPPSPPKRFTTMKSDVLSSVVVYVFPAISLCGMCGNVTSVVVLVRCGLDKSYHIMLVGLACADSCFLMAMFLYGVTGHTGCQHLSQKDSAWFFLYTTLTCLDYGGAYVSFLMPIFITSERIVAIYFPMEKDRLVSVRKTTLAVVCLFLVCFVLAIYLAVSAVHQPFAFTYIPCDTSLSSTSNNSSNDISNISNNSNNNLILYDDPLSSEECLWNLSLFRNLIDKSPTSRHFTSTFIFGPVPVALVLAGCVVLVVKINLVQARRHSMSRGTSSSVRMTMTVVAVCVVYAVCSLCMFIIHSNIVTDWLPTCGEDHQRLQVTIMEVVNGVALFNSSINFIIYVVLNPRYRNTFYKLVCRNTRRQNVPQVDGRSMDPTISDRRSASIAHASLAP